VNTTKINVTKTVNVFAIAMESDELIAFDGLGIALKKLIPKITIDKTIIASKRKPSRRLIHAVEILIYPFSSIIHSSILNNLLYFSIFDESIRRQYWVFLI
jgi:hypothetical protein